MHVRVPGTGPQVPYKGVYCILQYSCIGSPPADFGGVRERGAGAMLDCTIARAAWWAELFAGGSQNMKKATLAFAQILRLCPVHLSNRSG
jgi:hypothetical protein